MKNSHPTICTLLLLLFFSAGASAQEWAHSWPGPYLKQSGRDIAALPNGNFMATGRAIEGVYDASGFFTPNEADIFLLEITPEGDTVRSILVQNREVGSLELVSVLAPTEDNGFILAGQMEGSSGNGEEDLLAMRIDGDGDKIWETIFDFGTREDFKEARRTEDGNFVLAGYYMEEPNQRTGFAMKIDPDGNILWNLPLVWQNGRASSVLDLEELPGGDLLICGRGALANHTIEGGFLLKANTAGSLIWVKEYEEASFVDAIAAMPDGSVFLGLFSGFNFITSEYQIMKTDADGNTIWLNSYPSEDFDLSIHLKRVASDKIAFVGNSLIYSQAGLDVEDAYTYFGLIDTVGNLLSSFAHAPAESSETLFSTALGANGCLAAVGTSTDTAIGSEPRLFCSVLQCFEPLNTARPIVRGTNPGLRIFPNPSATSCFIALPEGMEPPDGKLSVFGPTGKMVLSKTVGGRRLEISMESWPPGIYQILWGIGPKAYSGRIVRW